MTRIFSYSFIPQFCLVVNLPLFNSLFHDTTLNLARVHFESQHQKSGIYCLLSLILHQIHSVSLTILASIHLLIHFSTHLCHHPHSRHPSLLQQILPTVDFF